jgi:transcriptional regulator with XRE-family HTH domain
LSRQITLLKGNRTTAEIIRGADVSRETYRKLERGMSVKLDTLMNIADYLDVTEDQRTNLVNAWVELEIGKHARHISIRPSAVSNTAELKDAQEIQSILKQLSPYDRQQLILAMVRPEVRRAIPALNKLHDNLKASPTEKTSYRKK